MPGHKEGASVNPTEEGRLVIQLTKALFANDINEAFRILGRHMDKRRLKVSADVINEFKIAGRIREV